MLYIVFSQIFKSTDHHPTRIAKFDKDFAKTLDFKDLNFPVKIKDIHKIEKKNSIGISIPGYENKRKISIYVSKQCWEEKHVDLFIIREGIKNIIFVTKI